MTEIAFRSGQPVFRDGKIATGSGCCPCLSLQLFPYGDFTDGDGSHQQQQDRYDNTVKPLVDQLQANLEAAGWTVTRNDSVNKFYYEIQGQPVEAATINVSLAATCECCIDIAALLAGDFCGPNAQTDQPEGYWADVSTDEVANTVGFENLLPNHPLYMRPICLFNCDAYAPYGINGVNTSMWVPVCDPTSEYCNPLP